MTCLINLHEKPVLRDPILIEGLPGIGLVANIATSYLIHELKAKLFGEIHCSTFQDIAITDEKGGITSPISKLYYYKGKENERDLIILYGNTQALTTRGQYELCWRILDMVEELGCRYIITLGGYRPGREVVAPKLYYAASDLEAAREAANLGAEVLPGQIFGVAGLLIGLGNLRGMKGFCLLAETPGTYPDKMAALEVLRAILKILRLKLDLNETSISDEKISDIKPFDFIIPSESKARKEEPKWLI